MTHGGLLAAGILAASVLTAAAALPPAHAAEPVVHNVTVPSTVRIELGPDGGLTLHQRSTRFEAYGAIPDDLGSGARFPPRLATITTATTQRPDDQTSSITVAVDDVSAPTLRRVASFTDPGSEGAVIGGLFFVTTEPGCCALPSRHRVRALETGALLFTSTGSGEAGAASWMEVPNAHPTVERWVAFEGHIGTPDYSADMGKVGDLLYGDRRGVLSHLVLRLKRGPGPDGNPDKPGQELAHDMGECGFLRWTEPGRPPQPGQGAVPASGQCTSNGSYFPSNLFSLATRDPAQPLGGFEAELSMDGDVYAAIPIAGDRFDLRRARLDNRLVAEELPIPR